MEKLIRCLEQATMVVAGICVVAIMLIVCYDGASRYLLGRPLQWAFDVVSNFLMVGAAYLALSSTFKHGDHISINVFYARMSLRMRAAVDVVWALLAVILFGLISYATAVHALEAYRGKEFLPGVVMWPVWLSYLPIPIGTGLLVLRLLHHAFTLVRLGENPFVATQSEGGAE